MGRKALGWKNLWSLTVLIFLRLKPMHPYELQSIIRMTHKDDFLQLNPGSLYNSIKRLLRAGLIEVAETTRAGRRPERTIYRITAQGGDEAIAWLRELLAKPRPDPNWFFAALSFLPALEPRDAGEQLRRRLAHLESEIQSYRHVLATITPRVGRLNLIEIEYAVALRTAELNWVKQIREELRSGELKWNPRRLQKHAANLFTTCLPGNTSGASTYRAHGGMHYKAPPLTPALSHPMGEGEPLTPPLSRSEWEREKHRRTGM